MIPKAVLHENLIINEIENGLMVAADTEMLASVITNLLHTTVSNTKSNCIKIAAKSYGNIILLHVKDNDKKHDSAINDCLSQVEPLAEKMGGCVTLSNNRSKGTTVAFSFYNNLLQAG